PRSGFPCRRAGTEGSPSHAPRSWAAQLEDAPTDSRLMPETPGARAPSTVDRRALARRVRLLVRRPAKWVIDLCQRLTPARLVHAGSSLGLDLFQPAHSRRSITAYPFVRMRAPLFARETTFVEQGPLVVLSRGAQRRLLPFPGDMGMGWGVEARWAAAARETGLRSGIVDAVAIRHPSSYGLSYD